MHALFFGVRKRFKRGIRLYVLTTLRCNYNCEYCSNRFYNGKMIRVDKELNVDGWVNKILSFPVPVREVVISGGEPMLRDDFAALVNELTLRGYFVTVQTNLSIPKRAAELKKSSRLRISATWHPSRCEYTTFNYHKMHFKGFRVDVTCPGKTNETGVKIHNKTRIYSPSEASENCLDIQRFVFAPNGMLFPSFRDMHEYYNFGEKDLHELNRLERMVLEFNTIAKDCEIYANKATEAA